VETLLRDFQALLTLEVENLRRLETLMRNQQASLVRRDVGGILESVSGQEECLGRIQSMEEERARLMARISEVLGLGEGGITLRQITEHLDPGVGEELRATGKAVRETLENIGRVNGENRRLIQHSLEFVQEMLAALAGDGLPVRTYGSSGTLSAEKRVRSLVNQWT